MTFSLLQGETWREVRQMITRTLLHTRNARAIVRKSGLRLGDGEFVGHSEVLWAQGSLWNTVPFTLWSLDKHSRPGVWGLWPSRAWNLIPYTVPGQYAYADLRGVAFARAAVNITSGNGRPTIAFVPVYSRIMNPMESRDEDASSLQFWYTPDGRTLLEWDQDLRVGGARAFGWPPKGACQPMQTNPPGLATARASIAGCHAGMWAPPPREALGTDDVVCCVAAIVNATQTELDTNVYTYIVRSFVHLQSVSAETEAWRTYFGALGQIED